MKRKIQEEKAIKARLDAISVKIPELVQELFAIQSEYLEQNQGMSEKELKANTKKILSSGMKMIYRKAILACGIKEEDLGRDIDALMNSKQFQGLKEEEKQTVLSYANKYQNAMSNLDGCITDDLVNEFVTNSKQTYDAKQDLLNKTTILAIVATVLFIAAITAFILSFGVLGAAVPVGVMIAATVLTSVAEIPVIMSFTNASEELAALEATPNHSKNLEEKCSALSTQLKSELVESIKTSEPTQDESKVLKRLEQMEKLQSYKAPVKRTQTHKDSSTDRILKTLETACKCMNDIASKSAGVSR